jgi:DNA-binding transcriptional LysR family regulator
VLAREARQVLDAVSAAALRTQRAGGVEPRLILAIKAGGDGGLLPAVLAAYEREPQSVPVQLLFHADRARMLREGQADAALLYSPFEDMGGFDTQPLLTEPAVAVMPAFHPLAGRTGLCRADLSGENVHRKPEDAQAGGISELMHRIALEEKVAVLPRSLTMPLRDDLASVPMLDEPPITLMLAWHAQSTSPAVAALARAAECAASVSTNGEL